MRTIALLAFLIVAGCSEQLDGGAPYCAELSEIATIGSQGSAAVAFTQVADIAVDHGRRLFVAQPRDGIVMVLEPPFERYTELGRRGDGPGEFQIPVNVFTRGDSIVVGDNGNRSVSVFDSDLRFVRRVALKGGPVDHIARAPNGVFVDGTLVVGTSAPAHLATTGAITFAPVLLGAADGTVGDTLFTVSLAHRDLGIRNPDRPWAGLFLAQPFADNPLWEPLSDGDAIIVVDRAVASAPNGADFHVTAIDAEGDTVYRRTIDYEPVDIPTSVADSIVNAFVEAVLRARGPGITSAGRARDAVMKSLHLPPSFPPVTAVFASQEGNFWIRREESDVEATWQRMLGKSGSLDISVRAPAQWRGLDAAGDTLWGVQTDSDGVQSIVGYEIDRDDCSMEE